MLILWFAAMNAIMDSKQCKNYITSAMTQNYSVEINMEKLTANFDERAGGWKLTDCLSK